MAKKTKRPQPQRRRPTTNPAPAPRPLGTTGGGPSTSAQGLATSTLDLEDADETAVVSSVTTSDVVTPRRVGRLDPAATRAARPGRGPQQAASAMVAPLDPNDTAIPFDRVPYVPGDLRRVGTIAGLMVVLIIIAAIIVSKVVS